MAFRKERISEITEWTQRGVMWEWCEVSDNSQNQYFSDHWSNVRRVRKIESKDTKVEHELTGKKILIDGRELTVVSIHKHWFLGFYLIILFVDENESHGTFSFQNISCHCPTITEDIENNKKRIVIL